MNNLRQVALKLPNAAKQSTAVVERRGLSAAFTSTGRRALSGDPRVKRSSGAFNASGRGRESVVDNASLWLSRMGYAVIGAAAAGFGVMYVTDPEGTTEAMKAVKSDIDEKIRFFTEPSREQLLPDFKPQYPGQMPARTLVIDFDDILVHSTYSRSTGWRVAKRPGAEAFLAYLSQFYEVVMFTSRLNIYADPILDGMDPNGYIAHRLYRAETKFEKGVFVKDLSVMNRQLDRVVVIDHDMKNLKYHPENAIKVPKWTGDPTDTALLDLMPFLESIVKEDVSDVREHLAVLRDRPIKEAVAEFNANASVRMAKEQENKGIFFSGSAPPAPPPPVDGEIAKGAVWSTLPTTSKLFHPQVDIPEEAKQLKKSILTRNGSV